jgi:rod shape-determining protein MreC
MRKLLDFLYRKRHWFVFILFELISFVLIYRNNSYQRSVLLSSANVVAANVSSLSGDVLQYMDLVEKNKLLLDKNGQLEIELLRLQDQLGLLLADRDTLSGYLPDSIQTTFPYQSVTASIVNKSVSHTANYLTINKGRLDGIAPDMGVVSASGVVGVISTVSDHFAVVLPLINPKFRLSCKVLGRSYFGSLLWDGRDVDYANIEELPRHVKFQMGDTIVTSGYSALFPPGIVVGQIEELKEEQDDNFYSLRVKLATSFAALSQVRVIVNYYQEEQKEIEKEALRND